MRSSLQGYVHRIHSHTIAVSSIYHLRPRFLSCARPNCCIFVAPKTLGTVLVWIKSRFRLSQSSR